MGEKIYVSVGPTIPCVACWEVYADYDGDAPDTAGLVTCSTEELAGKVCELLVQAGPENDGPIKWLGKEWTELPLPCVEGWQWKRRFKARLTWRPREAAVATTVSEALRLIDED